MNQAIIILLMTSITTTFGYYSSRHHRCNYTHQDKHPVVTTPLGAIRGALLESRLNKTIYAFRGIAYAKPPIGECRFKPPVPIQHYQGVYDATEDKPMCPQMTTLPVNEDCLTLNVYSTKLPEDNNKAKRPVIVFIHPGGFWDGGSPSNLAGPQYLMDQDIVLVTLNYRLGSLGFLATGDKHSPGNNGLKDQVQALRWVQQNIEPFGGDKDSVTIFGYGAGAFSVVLHMMSPMSKGLFHKVISMSGSPTGQWLFGTHQTSVARRQAKFVGCPSEGTSEEIVKCLKTIPYDKLGKSKKDFTEFGHNPILIWTPVVEPDFGQERFLVDQPVRLIQERKFQQIPFLTGVTDHEYDYNAFEILENSTLTEELDKNWETIAPVIFLYERDSKFSRNVTRGLRKNFLNDHPITNNTETAKGLGDMYTDAFIGFSVDRAVKLISQYSSQSVYHSKFGYKTKQSFADIPTSNQTKVLGIVHPDLIYLFYMSVLYPKIEATTPVESKIVDKVTKLLANFATYGNPTPKPSKELDDVTWERFTSCNLKYLDIGKTLVMKEKLYEDRYREWDKLFPLDHYTQQVKNGYLS